MAKNGNIHEYNSSMLLLEQINASAFLGEVNQSDLLYDLRIPAGHNRECSSTIEGLKKVFRANFHEAIEGDELRTLNAVIKVVAVSRGFVDEGQTSEVIILEDDNAISADLSDEDFITSVNLWLNAAQGLLNSGALHFFSTNHTVGAFDGILPSIFAKVVATIAIELDQAAIYRLIHFASKKVLLNLMLKDAIREIPGNDHDEYLALEIRTHELVAAVRNLRFGNFERCRIRSTPAGCAHIGIVNQFINEIEINRTIYLYPEIGRLDIVRGAYGRVIANPLNFHIGRNHLCLRVADNAIIPSKASIAQVLNDMKFYYSEVAPTASILNSPVLPRIAIPSANWRTVIAAYVRLTGQNTLGEGVIAALNELMIGRNNGINGEVNQFRYLRLEAELWRIVADVQGEEGHEV